MVSQESGMHTAGGQLPRMKDADASSRGTCCQDSQGVVSHSAVFQGSENVVAHPGLCTSLGPSQEQCCVKVLRGPRSRSALGQPLPGGNRRGSLGR